MSWREGVSPSHSLADDTVRQGYGPWRTDIGDGERRTQLRSTRALAHVFLGPNHPVSSALERAETEESEEALACAWSAFQALPTVPKRRILAHMVRLMQQPHKQ